QGFPAWFALFDPAQKSRGSAGPNCPLSHAIQWQQNYFGLQTPGFCSTPSWGSLRSKKRLANDFFCLLQHELRVPLSLPITSLTVPSGIACGCCSLLKLSLFYLLYRVIAASRHRGHVGPRWI